MIAKDRKKEEELMTQRKLETEKIMQNLQEQSDDLRVELQEVREQAFVMDRFGEESVEREQRKLEETLRAAHAVEVKRNANNMDICWDNFLPFADGRSAAKVHRKDA